MAADSFFIDINEFDSSTNELKINYGTALDNSKGIKLKSTGGTCPDPGTYEDFYKGGSGIDLPGFLISKGKAIDKLRIQVATDPTNNNTGLENFKSGWVTDASGTCYTFGVCTGTSSGYFDTIDLTRGTSFASLQASSNTLPYNVYLNIGTPRFVAFGSDKSDGYRDMLYSDSNGLSWQRMSEGVNTAVLGTAYGNTRWVAGADWSTSPINPSSYYAMLYSSDGICWQNSDSSGDSFDFEGLGVAYSDFERRWVAVGDNTTSEGGPALGNIMWSDNGSCWVKVTSGSSFSIKGTGVAYGKGTWVAVGNSSGAGYNNIMYSKNNGTSWTTISEGSSFPFGSGYAHSVAYGKDIWVAVSQDVGTVNKNRKIMWSDNGTCWVHSTSSGASFIIGGYDVAYGNNLWVAVGDNNTSGLGSAYGNILYSSDGKTWTATSTGDSFSGSGRSVVYGNNYWVATGEDTDPYGRIMWSTNGTCWVKTNTGVSFTSDRGVAVGYGFQ